LADNQDKEIGLIAPGLPLKMIYITQVTHATLELAGAFEKLIPQLSQRKPPTLDELSALIASGSIVLAARFPGQAGPIVGSGTLAFFSVPTGLRGHIEDVVVDQAVRGHGIGEAIVAELLARAKALGLESVSLTCNPTREAANTMYRKMGFTKRETNVYSYDLGKESSSRIDFSPQT
jgi:ribosomal protein S18 acetylase RimI-like enzyme